MNVDNRTPSRREPLVALGSERNYADPQVTMDTWAATAGHITGIVRHHRMSPLVSGMLVEMFRQGHAAGLGSLDIAAFAELVCVPDSPLSRAR